MTKTLNRPEWDELWMNMADELGARSRCARAEIGCVIVSEDNRVLAATYVGPARNFAPSNVDPKSNCTSWCPRAQPGASLDASYSNCVSCHAEQNGFAQCEGDPRGGRIYVNGSMCIMCAKLAAAAGIAKAVMKVHESDSHRHPTEVIEFLENCGIEVKVVSA